VWSTWKRLAVAKNHASFKIYVTCSTPAVTLTSIRKTSLVIELLLDLTRHDSNTYMSASENKHLTASGSAIFQTSGTPNHLMSIQAVKPTTYRLTLQVWVTMSWSQGTLMARDARPRS
jgi:hypothetical protein